ncbi:helix-turn-helix domain-containing protein [Streptomyces sp. NPDC012888]|uniref:helix-turn-helix domain-containing protein n=1 Tax=Streptomyces sp. NPDC012888 TaxID=3364855 RepID=UPI0036BB2D02
MSRDWERLGKAIEAARDALGMSQVALAEAAGISESTVQNYEAGQARKRLPVTLPALERALGWEAGSGVAILEGGDPSKSSPSAPFDLPLRVTQALGDGPLLDTKIMDLDDGSGARMIVVVKGKEGATPEEIRHALEAWERTETQLRSASQEPS